MIGALRTRKVPLRLRLRWIGDIDERRPVEFHRPGEGVHLRLVSPCLLLRRRNAAVIGTVSHIDPVAVGCIRPGRDLQSLTPLQIVVADQPYVFRPVRHRISCRLLTGWRNRLLRASRHAGEKQPETDGALLGSHAFTSESRSARTGERSGCRPPVGPAAASDERPRSEPEYRVELHRPRRLLVVLNQVEVRVI
jgi:hypothetical protein